MSTRPIFVLALCMACSLTLTAGAQIVKINEVLYDTPSGTGAFTELYGTPGDSLDFYELVGIDGATGSEYRTISLFGYSIPMSGYFVIAQDASVPNADVIDPDIDWENGPDQIVLRESGADRDSLCYGDSMGVLTTCEGSPTALPAAGSSLTRDANSTDTNDNLADFLIDPVPTPGGPFAGTCAGVASLVCDSDCTSNDVNLSWVNQETYTAIEIYRDGGLVATLPGSATSATDGGVASGTYLYEVRAQCANGVITPESCTVSHCPPPPSSGLIISEIVYGTFMDQARWVEVTNCGGSPVDLSFYSIGWFLNGDMNLDGNASVPLQGTLAAGDSYVFEFSNAMDSLFSDIYGFTSDQYAGGPYIDGNDVVALFSGPATTDGMGNLTGTIIDTYGDRGVNGLGTVWEYTQGYSYRNPGAMGSDFFQPSEWTFGGVGSLETFMGPDANITQMLNLTTPGTHDCGASPLPDFVRGDCNADGLFNLADAISGLSYLFVPGNPVPPCLDSCDANDSGALDLADMIYALNSLFIPGSPQPAPPYPGCGTDPTMDSLDCGSFPACP